MILSAREMPLLMVQCMGYMQRKTLYIQIKNPGLSIGKTNWSHRGRFRMENWILKTYILENIMSKR